MVGVIAQRVMERLLSAIDQYTQQETLPLVPNTASDTLLAQCQATLDQSMQLPAKEAQRLERRLGEAMLARKLLAVVHCFTLVHNQYRLYEHAAPYEQLSNDARAERLTLQQLALDMPRHEWHYREVLQLAHYLAQRATRARLHGVQATDRAAGRRRAAAQQDAVVPLAVSAAPRRPLLRAEREFRSQRAPEWRALRECVNKNVRRPR